MSYTIKHPEPTIYDMSMVEVIADIMTCIDMPVIIYYTFAFFPLNKATITIYYPIEVQFDYILTGWK